MSAGRGALRGTPALEIGSGEPVTQAISIGGGVLAGA